MAKAYPGRQFSESGLLLRPCSAIWLKPKNQFSACEAACGILQLGIMHLGYVISIFGTDEKLPFKYIGNQCYIRGEITIEKIFPMCLVFFLRCFVVSSASGRAFRMCGKDVSQKRIFIFYSLLCLERTSG